MSAVDWDKIQMETGLCEDNWREEVGVENPCCPMLDRGGYLPVSLSETKRIFDENCNPCFLFESPPHNYPSCPWAERMAEELREAELI